MVSFVPLPLGSDIQGFVPSPMMKMLEILIANIRACLSAHERYLPSGEGPVQGILDVHDIEPTDVLFAVRDDTSTTHVTPTSDHHNVSGVKVNKIDDLPLLKVKLESVVDLDGRVRIADGAAVVSDDMGNALGAESNLTDFEELEGGFLRSDAVDSETTLDVVKEPKVLARLLNGDSV